MKKKIVLMLAGVMAMSQVTMVDIRLSSAVYSEIDW